MIVSGGIAFIWVDPQQGSSWSWPDVYRAMALCIVAAAVFSGVFARSWCGGQAAQRYTQRRIGFRRAAAVAVGFIVTRFALSPWRALVVRAGSSVAACCGSAGPIVALFAGIALTVPSSPGPRGAQRLLLGSLASCFSSREPPRSWPSSFSTSSAMRSRAPCSRRSDTGHATAPPSRRRQQGDRLWLTIGGALVAGAPDERLGCSSLLVFGVLQMLSNLGFWWLSLQGAARCRSS